MYRRRYVEQVNSVHIEDGKDTIDVTLSDETTADRSIGHDVKIHIESDDAHCSSEYRFTVPYEVGRIMLECTAQQLLQIYLDHLTEEMAKLKKKFKTEPDDIKAAEPWSLQVTNL